MSMKHRPRRAFAATVTLAFVGCFVLCDSQLTAGAQDGGSARSDRSEVAYSHWLGAACSISHIADMLCWMRLEARSASGELLGFVLFGQEEGSRFLAIETLRSADRMPLVLKIDGVAISPRPIACRAEDEFCSVVLSVDNDLLDRLMSGSALSVEFQGVTRLRFPLRDFAQSRHMLM